MQKNNKERDSMRVLLLDNEKITKLTLPDEIDGVFQLKYHPSWANAEKDLFIEAKDDKWILKSNDNIILASVGAGMNINSIIYRIP